MKIETLLLIGIGLYLWSKYSGTASNPQPGQTGFVGPVWTGTPINTGVTWIPCNSPGADPVMCGFLD